MSVINILKDRIYFLENELSKKDTINDYLSNEAGVFHISNLPTVCVKLMQVCRWV